jgi:hypothetical protein
MRPGLPTRAGKPRSMIIAADNPVRFIDAFVAGLDLGAENLAVSPVPFGVSLILLSVRVFHFL